MMPRLPLLLSVSGAASMLCAQAIMRQAGNFLQATGVDAHGEASENVAFAPVLPPQYPAILPAGPELQSQPQVAPDPVWPPKYPLGGSDSEPQDAARPNDLPQSSPDEAPRANLTYRLFDRFIVLPEYNLLFCYIEKVACTAFNDLFSQLRRRFDPKIIRTKGPIGWFQNSPYTRWYSKADLERIMTNSSWHKAVFYRDPVERFVSAYRSKCEHYDQDGNYSCHQAFGNDYASFPDAASKMFDMRNYTDMDEKVNAHFVRQSSFCGGLDRTLQYYDTVEELNVNTAREKTLKLLHKIGADPEGIEDFDTLFPPPKMGLQEEDNHTTYTSEHLREYFPADHPEVLSEVFLYYEEDYRVFNISQPRWQEDQLAEAVMAAQDINGNLYEEVKKQEEKLFNNMDEKEQASRR